MLLEIISYLCQCFAKCFAGWERRKQTASPKGHTRFSNFLNLFRNPNNRTQESEGRRSRQNLDGRARSPRPLGNYPALHVPTNNFQQLVRMKKNTCQRARSMMAMALVKCNKLHWEQNGYLGHIWIRFIIRQMPNTR